MVLRRAVRIERSYQRACVRPGRRHGVWIWFDPEELPPELLASDRAAGDYVIERDRTRRSGWRIITEGR